MVDGGSMDCDGLHDGFMQTPDHAYCTRKGSASLGSDQPSPPGCALAATTVGLGLLAFGDAIFAFKVVTNPNTDLTSPFMLAMLLAFWAIPLGAVSATIGLIVLTSGVRAWGTSPAVGSLRGAVVGLVAGWTSLLALVALAIVLWGEI